jgi:hypothetical protein
MVLDPCENGPPVVQLMIFDGWGGAGNQSNKSNMAGKLIFILYKKHMDELS